MTNKKLLNEVYKYFKEQFYFFMLTFCVSRNTIKV